MSQAAYCQAIRDALQTALQLDSNTVQVMFDGQPTPTAGQEFLAVHPGNWTAQGEDFDLDEKIDVCVTISRRLGTTPKDRTGIAVWMNLLDPRARQVIAAIHFNNGVMQAANALITAQGASDFFHKPVTFQGVQGLPTVRGPEWFTAMPADGTTADAGVSLTLRFGGAERTQGVDDGIA